MSIKRIILLGAPGSGKGTLSESLIKEYGVVQISTGDIFRENIKNETPLGLKAKDYMNRGELVPDSLVIELVTDRLQKDDTKNGYILDGFPRTIAQAKELDEILYEKDEEIDYVIYINVSEDILISRISGRRLCKTCGKSYHIKNIPPKVEGICDECGGELYQRDDDNEETAKNRIETYEKETLPLVAYYKEKGILYEFDGGTTPEKVFSEVKEIL